MGFVTLIYEKISEEKDEDALERKSAAMSAIREEIVLIKPLYIPKPADTMMIEIQTMSRAFTILPF